MPFFADADQFYASARSLLGRIVEEEPGAAESIMAARLVIRLRCSRHNAEFTINGRKRPAEIVYGPARIRPTIDLEPPADTLHRIMLGEESLQGALANGWLKVRGPVLKAAALGDLFSQVQALYPQIVSEQGLG